MSYVSAGRRKTTTQDKQLPRALSGVPHGDERVCMAMSAGGRLPARLKEHVLPRHGGTKGNENESRTAISFGCFSERVWKWFSATDHTCLSHVPSQVPPPLLLAADTVTISSSFSPSVSSFRSNGNLCGSSLLLDVLWGWEARGEAERQQRLTWSLPFSSCKRKLLLFTSV